MVFAGFQKLTLLDYPGKVACILFTRGCNFFCPFCHNSMLIDGGPTEEIDEDSVFAFLEKRKGILEGVCISGGEPLLNSDIGGFIEKVRALGYLVKLDTNGTYPDRLRRLVEEGLVDYVAMDIKNSFGKYCLTAGTDRDYTDRIKESIDLLMEGRVDYEFRTTLVRELHTPEDMHEIGNAIRGAKRYFLQNFVLSDAVPDRELTPLGAEEMEQMKKIAMNYVDTAVLRGI